jgi:hypothetical protein
MRGPGSRFTVQQVETLRMMAARGESGIVIARALGVSAEAIRKKAVALGVRLRPIKKSDQLRFKIEPAVAVRLREEAKLRGTTSHGLARQLLTVIAWDHLFDAVLDPPSLRRPSAY